MTNLAGRLQAAGRRQPMAADGALAVALAVAALVSFAAFGDQVRSTQPGLGDPGTVSIVASMLGFSLPLAWRRRFPLSVAMVVVAAFLIGRVLVDVREAAISVMAASLAIYSAALHGHRRFRTAILSLCSATILAEVGYEVFLTPTSAPSMAPLAKSFVVLYNVALLALPWVLGIVIRSLREHERELADRVTELHREREENARQAVFAERVRIAREMHDVLAHHVSVMGVQAGAARRVMQREPAKATEALSSIEASSRQAVAELHRLLGFLRRPDEPDEPTPQPGLAQLDDLVALVQGALAVDLTIDGTPRALSPTLEVSAYRVVQEALTNARKHSGGTTATVRVSYGPSALEVEVFDNGKGREDGRTAKLGGLGLIGMRERASLHGGHLRTGPRPGGGFGVHATFPLRDPHRDHDGCERMTITVVLVDDQAMVRAGFRMILEAEDDIEVTGEASDGEQAVVAIRQHRPDVVLMDIQMPRMDGLEAARRISLDTEIHSRVVMLTTFERDDYVFEALRAGASGFLLKNAPPEELVHAVRVVASGEALLAPSVTRRVIEEYARQPASRSHEADLDRLTERETEVLVLLATGKSNVELATHLYVGEGTIKTHVSSLLTKLGLRDRMQAVVFAYESGLVERGRS